SEARALTRLGKKGLGKTIAVANVYLILPEALQAGGILNPDYEPVDAPYFFLADDGSVFIVQEAGWFTNPKRVFIEGPRKGQSEVITKAEVQTYMGQADARWGRYIPGSLLRDP